MPVRNEDNNLPKETTKKDKLIELGQLGAEYLFLKREQKNLTAKVKSKNDALKTNIKTNLDLFEINGNHKELSVPLGDGKSEVFIQLQKAESVSVVSNIVDLVKQKLGDKADNFIMKVEVLHETALESMRSQGLITDEDLLDWTITKETERLIVKSK